jgi:hypothetical protein
MIMITPTLVLTVIAGFAILLFGRQLFWLFVGVVGFLVAFELATEFLAGQPEWVILLIAIVAGIVGALLSIFVQYGVVAVAGFFAGALAAQSLLQATTTARPEWALWLALIIGGLLGALLVLVVFDWALIVLSSVTGASMLVQSITLPGTLEVVVFIALLIVGIVFQIAMMPRTGGTLFGPGRRVERSP